MTDVRFVKSSMALCASCGLPLGQRTAICPSCGALAPLERLFARIKARFARIRTDGRSRLETLVWIAAAMPFLFITPLAALAFVWLRPDRRTTRLDPTWITIVALLNLAVSTSIVVRYEPSVATWVETQMGVLDAVPSPLPHGSKLEAI